MTGNHIEVEDADKIYKETRKTRYQIETINWTYVGKKGNQDMTKVYKRSYIYSLPNLIKFIRDTAEVAEDILTIERVK